MENTRKTAQMFKISLPEIEKVFLSNIVGLNWQIVHQEVLQTLEGELVHLFYGVTSAYGAVSFSSLLSHGGGYVPFFIKLTEINELETSVEIVVTGSETVCGDFGDRNGHIGTLLLEMCEKDCTHKSFMEKMHDLFGHRDNQ